MELSAIGYQITTSAQAWKLIEKDYTLRLSLVTSEWATEHLMAWNAVFAEGRKRGNAAYFGPALVEMEIAEQDKRAEWCYQTCCEIWEVQGRTKSRPFYRAIFESCLQPMISIREGAFKHQLELHQMRTGAAISQGLAAICGHLKREEDRLRAKWNTKLEIAARDNEYQQHQLRPKGQRQGGPLPASPLAHEENDLQRLAVSVATEVTRAFSPFLEQTAGGGRNSTRARASQKTGKTKAQLRKTGVIFGAIQSGLKALAYCTALDARGVKPPEHWTEDDCPVT